MKAILQKSPLLLLTTFLLLLGRFNIASAQSSRGNVSGKVTTNDHKPALGVTLRIKGQPKKNAITDEQGYFEINNLAPGDYELQLSLVGYERQYENIHITADQNTSITIELKLSKNQLNEVVVSSAHSKIVKKESDDVARMPLKNLENPQVYAVISNELMKEQMVVDYKSALRNATGTSTLLQAANGRSYTFMRGFITGNFMRNGLGANQYSGIDPANIDRIEVIKGPSGTLFGSGLVSYGGLVNRITKKPLDTAHTEITYSTGSFGLNRITADINAPLTQDKKALFRVNTAFNSQGSFMDSGFEQNYFIAPTFTYKANDRLTFNIDAELYQRHTSGLTTYGFEDISQWAGKSFKDIPLTYNRSYSTNDVDTRLLSYNIYLQANYKINENWNSQTLFTYNGVDAPNQLFMDPTILNPTAKDPTLMQRSISKLSDRYHSVQAQQNFNGDVHIGNIRNRVLVGIDYTAYTQDPNYFIGTTFDKINYAQPGAAYISRGAINKALDTLTASPSDQKTYNYAVYLADAVNITDRLLAMLSLRIDRYQDKGNRDLTTGITATGFAQTKASPKLGLVYQLIKNELSVFGNYQNGFNYSNAKAEDGKLFKPEQAYQYESGIKLETFNNRLSATLSYYDILVKDKLRTDPNNRNFSIQDATQRSKGIEAELIANPVNGLNIILGYGYNDSEFTKSDSDVQGKRPYSTPKHMVNSWISYTVTKGILKGAGLGAGGNYASKSFFDDTNYLTLPSFATVNATAFYDHRAYRIGLKADNINNEHYWGPFGQVQTPRSFTASFSLKF